VTAFAFSAPGLVAHIRGTEQLKTGSVRAAIDFMHDEKIVFTHAGIWTDAPTRAAVAIELHEITNIDTSTIAADLARLEREMLAAQYAAHYRDGVWAETHSDSGATFHTAREIAQLATPQVEWVASPWVARGAVTELVGKIKASGKTTFTTHLCRHVVTGLPFLGLPTLAGPVIYLTEQPVRSFREALRRAQLLGRDDFVVLFWHDVVGRDWPGVVATAVAEANRVGAVLLVVDTLAQFAGLRGDAENNSGDALRAMQPLQEAAAVHNLGVIALRHERKAGGDVGDSGRGSSAYGGAVDIVLALKRPEGKTRPTIRMLQGLSRFDETPDTLMIELTAAGYTSLGSEPDVALAEARTKLADIVPTGEQDAKSISELQLAAGGLPRTTVQRVVDEWLGDGWVHRIGAGKRGSPYRFWHADDDGDDDPETDDKVSAQTAPLYGQKEAAPQHEHADSDAELF
jgi:hypothetical protein